MPASDIVVTPYNGALLPSGLLLSTHTILLPQFGAPVTGELIDSDGVLSSSSTGQSSFDGAPLTYIGTGTATPGVDVLGVIVPTGTPVTLVVFSAGDQIYFHYPNGPPNLLSAVAVVTDVDPVSYQAFATMCFADGTLISTPEGERPVETLRTGDRVRDIAGRSHPICWAGGFRPARRGGTLAAAHCPVRFAPDALGPGRPERVTWLSPQHRVLVRSGRTELLFGVDRCLVPARALVGAPGITSDPGRAELSYHHILCERHILVRANGLAAETLLPATTALRRLGLPCGAKPPPPAAPILRGYEAAVLARTVLAQP